MDQARPNAGHLVRGNACTHAAAADAMPRSAFPQATVRTKGTTNPDNHRPTSVGCRRNRALRSQPSQQPHQMFLQRKAPWSAATPIRFGTVGDAAGRSDIVLSKEWLLLLFDRVPNQRLRYSRLATKKADVGEHPKVFPHVGLLFDEPPAPRELLFI